MTETASHRKSDSAKLGSVDVIDVLTDLFILRGLPAFIQSDNGAQFVAQADRQNRRIKVFLSQWMRP